MEFYIEILIIGHQSHPNIINCLYDYEICEHYILDKNIVILKLKTNKISLFSINDNENRFSFVDKNIFPMIASDNPYDHTKLKIIVLFGINCEFSLHYKIDDIHTIESEKIYIMNYHNYPNNKISYGDTYIMSNDQFLILNKNLPKWIFRQIQAQYISDRTGDIILLYINDYTKNNIAPDLLKHNFSDLTKYCGTWLNLKKLVNDTYNYSDLESKIFYEGIMVSQQQFKKYPLDLIRSDIDCTQVYVNIKSELMPLLLSLIDDLSPEEETIIDKKVKLSNCNESDTNSDSLSIDPSTIKTINNKINGIKQQLLVKLDTENESLKQKLLIESRRTESYKKHYIEMVELFNKLSPNRKLEIKTF
jgi:hypothetical protein